jgi:hypothetical protein
MMRNGGLFGWVCGLLWGGILASSATAVTPLIDLGVKPSFGLYQPRVSVEVFDGGLSLGPSSNSFLLDTGASSVLVYAPAGPELKEGGMVIDGMFEEQGLNGSSLFDVSTPYRVEVSGTIGTESIDAVRLLSTDSGRIDPTGLLSINGIVGMPAMTGRVTTLDNTTTQGALTLSMGVSFSQTLPDSDNQRFTIPLGVVDFPPSGEGPFPTASPLATLRLTAVAGAQQRDTDLVLDSGAQITIISQQLATDLGLDTNGNGDFSDETQVFVPLGGLGGTTQAPVLTIDELRLPTDQGYALLWRNAQVVVQDIDPSIAGVFGADLLTGDGGLDLSFLGGNTDLGGLFGDSDLTALLELLGITDLNELLAGLSGDDESGLGDLLGGLLGGLDLFSEYPLESNFDRVHFDFRHFAAGAGQLVLDVNSDVSQSLLNGDGRFDVRDIDDLVNAFGTSDSRFDLTGDGSVTRSDFDLLVTAVFRTQPGDADLDGDVNFADFVALANHFGQAGGWGDGDFDADGVVQFNDFTLLANHFGQPEAIPVPEPNGLAMVGMLLLGRFAFRRSSRVCGVGTPADGNGSLPQ